jgi:PAS domain S-box-containing protein
MFHFLASLFDTSGFEPHGYCLLWQPGLIWTTVGADVVVAVSYFTIPVALGYFALKRRDLAFPWVFYLFGAFILLCGGTHVMEAVTFWEPAYGLEALIKGATAVVSLATAAALWPLMPRALALPSADDLKRLNAELESRVIERTASLTQLTEELRAEIAERRRVEEGLRASSELVRATIDAAPYPITIIDLETKVLGWNKAAERMYGITADDIIGQPYRSIVPDSGQIEFESLFERAKNGERLEGIQVRRQTSDGKPLDVKFSCAPLREADGRVRALVYIVEDTTQRNLMEAQLRQAQKMEAIGNLTGGMAHDFNNLLGVIIGNLDSLEGDVAGDRRNGEPIADALEAALRGADLIKRLLAFARRQPLHPQKLDINAHVDRMVALLRRTLGENILLQVALDPAPWPVLVDSAQLEAAIANLATNARDAMPRGGTLMIRTSNAHLDEHYAAEHADVTPGDYTAIEICDTGTGIPPDLLPRIFEPFFTTKSESGSGLGLSMVFGFIKQSGGHLNVYSEVGKGTCFRIYLPPTSRADAVEEADTGDPRLAVGTESILVVEDNEKLRNVVVKQLVGLGYTVREADSAAAALALLRQGAEIDLMFTDIVMPGEMNGTDLVDAACRLKPDLKVLFTSGFPETRAENGGWIGGNARLLAKPYRRDQLARMVRQILDE